MILYIHKCQLVMLYSSTVVLRIKAMYARGLGHHSELVPTGAVQSRKNGLSQTVCILFQFHRQLHRC